MAKEIHHTTPEARLAFRARLDAIKEKQRALEAAGLLYEDPGESLESVDAAGSYLWLRSRSAYLRHVIRAGRAVITLRLASLANGRLSSGLKTRLK